MPSLSAPLRPAGLPRRASRARHPFPSRTAASRTARTPAVLRCLLLAALLVGAALPVDARAEQARWQWPLPAPHHVLAPFEAPEHRYGPGHRGIDIAVRAEGAEVRAVEAGTVRFSGEVAGRGVVSVRHADGLISTYEPVGGALEAGSPVAAGDVLGSVEHRPELSHCPGARCLHLGARRGEEYLDPMLLLGARGPSVLLPWGGEPVGAAAHSPPLSEQPDPLGASSDPAAREGPGTSRGPSPFEHGGGRGPRIVLAE